ncbi:hypothetical protein K1T71_013215 [Dendrolimus kikuchii]|uniref:Uncharacterized protein n=1 Tax=Dendrolimus kikuchii TaxID=765133 RepID=A0ACC1CHG8_9NEOP|nr:hypothetical protein K1T71_013215 [Dendrolimus kikuchii]
MGGTSLGSNLVSVLILAVLWSTTYAADKCSISCTGSSPSQAFQNGQKYNYAVEGTVTIYLTGADKQETSVKLLGQVSVTALGNCAHELAVQTLGLSGPDGKKYSSPPGIEKAVRFQYQDGRVGPEICAEEGDTRRSLNIKRAIISLLQTEQKPSTQIDVFGVCPTEVSSSQEGGAVLVHRTRDLSRCAHREQGRNDLIVSVYNPTAEIKESQILRSTLHVESKVNNGVPEKVSANEEYLYEPFSIGENGARARVHTKLTLANKSGGGGSSSHCTEPRTIIFENPHGVSVSQNNANSVITAVRDTAKAVSNNAAPKSAGEFAQLIRIMRSTNKDDLMRVFQQVKGKDLEKRVFLDGLLRAGTGYSIEASIQILKANELEDIEQKLVYLSLGNAKHVSTEALKAAASLLDTSIPKEIYLGIGALAGTYCREHQCHNIRNDGIYALSQKLANKLQNCKSKNKHEEYNIVAVLKGIRNIRHLEDCLIEKLYKCVSDNSVKARVKVAALEAFHADPCSDKIHKLAMETMKNKQLDSEIRIKAYLAVIQCPCAHSASEIKKLLESEPVHQVGNFISSSLRHIRASSSPDKALARQHYGQIRTPNKFNVDDRKYSFYREMSFNVDALGLGGSVEETVIYSQDSFLPRSVDFNLTTEIFGQNFNVLEFGGRQGNLDRVIEHFMGPKGVFKTTKPQKLYDDLYKQFMETKKKVEEGISRRRRSVKADIDNFDKTLRAESAPYNNELDLDVYVKLFGTEAVFLSLGDDTGIDFNKFLDLLLKSCTGGINALKHFQQDIRTHILFLDAELSYPTSTGLPLRLDLIGSATARLDVATNLDIRQIIRSPQNAKVDIKFVPSSAVEITGQFLVDADAVATGLKVVTNVHSSTGVHVIAKVLENGKGFDLQIGLPVDKQEIITASNNLVYFTAEKGQKEKEIPLKVDGDRKEFSGCFDQLSGVLGLTLCAEVKAPFSVSGPDASASISKYLARYPLSGPMSVKLVLEKTDLRGYHIKGLLRGDNNGRRGFELLFDAEGNGSKNRRTQLTGELVYNGQEASIQLNLDSPIKVIHAQIGGYSKPDELMGLVKVKLDDQEYYGKIGFNVQGNEARSVYKPILEYKVPDESGTKREIKIDGQLVKESSGPQTKYTLQGIVIKLPNNENLEMSGHVQTQSQTKEVDFNVVAKDYAYVRGSLKGYDFNLEFNNKLNAFVNFILKGHFEIGDTMHNELDLTYGGDCKDPNRRIVFYQILKYHTNSPQDFNVITKNKLEIRALPFKIRADADVDPKKVDINLEGLYLDKSAQLDLDARTGTKKPGDYSVKLVANIDKSGVEVFAKRDITNAEKSNLENYIEVKNVGKYELSGVSLHKNKPNDVNFGFIGYLKVTDASKKHQETKFDVGYLENPNQYSSHAKITDDKGELVDYLFTLNKGASPSGQLKVIVRSVIAANGNLKVTDSNGKGNGMIIVDMQQSHRKIKADVSFIAKEPVFNADFDIYLNFEKDNNDKLHFSTNNRHTDKLLDSKTSIAYRGKRTEFVVRQDGFNFLGKTHTNVEFVLPTERCINLKINRDVTEKDGLYNGNVDFAFTDSEKKGSAGSSITYKAKAVDSNFEKETINYEGQLEFKLKDGKQLQNSFSVKTVPEGDKIKFDFKTYLTGNMLPKPATLLVSYVGTEVMQYDDDNYRVQASYGDDTTLEIAGVFVAKLLGETGDKKYLNDYTVTVRLPSDKVHDLKYVNTILYHLPEGKDMAEYTVVQSVQVNSDVYKVDANGKVGPETGFGVVKLLAPHVEPVILDVKYKNHREGDRNKGSVELKAKYGKGNSAAVAIDNAYSPHDNNLKVKVNVPQNEKLKKLEFSVNSKNPTPETYTSSMIIDADGRVYKTDSSIVLSKAHPVLDISYTSPSSDKIRRVYVKGSSLSSTQGKVEIKVDNVYDICLDAVSEGNIQKDNVAFHFQANSEKLGFNNYVVDISSKDSGSGKRLEFKAVNDNKNVLSGRALYCWPILFITHAIYKIPIGFHTILISDYLQVCLKVIRTVIFNTFFNLAIGERSYVAESRVTNLEYKNSYVYCEEKKQCAHAEIQSKTDISKPGTIQNVINAGFDLRKLGIMPEFGLQIKDTISDNQLPQYLMDVHINKEEKKYHLHVYDTPEFGAAKSGVEIHLPSRVVAAEYSLTYPKDKMIPLPVTGEVSLNMNKKKQGHKFAARYLVDIKDEPNTKSVVAEIGFFHPSIQKEALARFDGAAITSGQGRFKLETAGTLSHPCLGSNRVGKVVFESSPEDFKFLVVAPYGQVVDVEASSRASGKKQSASLKVCVFDAPPVTVSAELEEFKRFELITEESDRKLSICGNIDPEKKVDISADVYVGGDKKNLARAAVFIQNKELKEEYRVDKDNFNTFYKILNEELERMAERIKQSGKKANDDYEQFLKHATPTAQRVSDAFSKDVKKFYEEISSDKVLKEMSHAFHDILQYFAKIIDDVITATKPLVDNITKTYIDMTNKIYDLYTKQIEPPVKKIYETVAVALKEYLNGVIEIVAYFAAVAEEFFKKYSSEIKELSDIFTNIFKDVAKLFVAFVSEFRDRIMQFYATIAQDIKDFPLIETIKKKYNELGVPDNIISILEELVNNIKVVAPTPEMRKFLEVLNAYAQKKLRNQQCDDNKELREIYQKLVSAITSLVQFFRSQLGNYGVQPVTPLSFGSLLFSPEALRTPPSLGEASFSLIQQLLTGDIPDPLDYIRAYRPRSLNPLEEVPAKLRGVVVNGQHIFTFDGRHLTFPGTCRYVLVHDYVDRNFTLAIQLQSGQPKALVLEDQSGTIVEIKDNGQATLNGAAHGYPIAEKDIYAFRQANGRIGMGSKYGLEAFCTTKLEVCYIEVSGFYLGKLRGLLGDGNNEPYDDFRLPNGKICTSESEFGNAYRLTKSCPPVQVPEHSHHQMHADLPPACEQVFGASSPLRAASIIMDSGPFRQACIHAVTNAQDPLHEACDLGRGYAALALTGLVPAVLPNACVKCTDTDKPRNIGDTYEIKLPNKQADIVVAVETTQSNEKTFKDLVVPLVSQLVDSLKAKRITDIKVYLTGVTAKFPYPILYDSDLKLKLKNTKIEFDDEQRYDVISGIEFGIEKLDNLEKQILEAINDVKIGLEISNVEAGYSALLDLPVRPGAVKHAITVIGEKCKDEFFLLEAVKTLMFNVIFENYAYTTSILAVTEGMTVGAGKPVAHVVGYTENAVLMLGDKKLRDSDNIRPTLKIAPDVCRDFVEGTDGIVLSSTNFNVCNAGQQKQYLQTAVNAIVQKMTSVQRVQECTCSYVDPFRVRSICFTKDKKEMARRRK